MVRRDRDRDILWQRSGLSFLAFAGALEARHPSGRGAAPAPALATASDAGRYASGSQRSA